MPTDTRFRPGSSGNPGTQWEPGRSGNPTGKSKRRLEFEAAFQRALKAETGPEEAVQLLVDAARAREPWAVRELLHRLSPGGASVPQALFGAMSRLGSSTEESSLGRLSRNGAAGLTSAEAVRGG